MEPVTSVLLRPLERKFRYRPDFLSGARAYYTWGRYQLHAMRPKRGRGGTGQKPVPIVAAEEDVRLGRDATWIRPD